MSKKRLIGTIALALLGGVALTVCSWSLYDTLRYPATGTAAVCTHARLSADGVSALLMTEDENKNLKKVYALHITPHGWRSTASYVVPAGRFTTTAFSPDGSTLLVITGSTLATVITQNSTHALTAWQLPSLGTPFTFGDTLALSHDGMTLLISGADNSIGQVYAATFTGDAWSAELLQSVDGVDPSFGTALALTPDGATALIGAPTATASAALVFSRIDGTWHHAASLAPDPERHITQFGYRVFFSPDGKTTLISGMSAYDGYTGDYHQEHAVFFRQHADGTWYQNSIIDAPYGDLDAYVFLRGLLPSDAAERALCQVVGVHA